MKIKIFVSEKISISSHEIDNLKNYIGNISGCFIDVFSNEQKCPQDSNLIIIGSPERNTMAGNFCDSNLIRNLRHDGYVIQRISEKNKDIALICRKTEKGDKHGIYHKKRLSQ